MKLPYHYLCSCGRRFSVGEREYKESGLSRIHQHIQTECKGNMMSCGEPPAPNPYDKECLT